MPIDLALILGIVQAATEFLPVSSSGHLLLFKAVLGPNYNGLEVPLAFDVLVHLATLLAVVVFLWKDIWSILSHLSPSAPKSSSAWHLALLVIVATLPVVFVGLFFKDRIEEAFTTVRVAGIGFCITTLWLGLAQFKQLQRRAPENEPEEGSLLDWEYPSLLQALLIGLAQAVAIIPGVSRSGSTVACALVCGLSAEAALRFSFLLSIPAILGAAVLQADALAAIPESHLAAYGAGFAVAAVAGWFAIKWLVVFTKKLRLAYFAFYTAILAAIILTLS